MKRITSFFKPDDETKKQGNDAANPSKKIAFVARSIRAAVLLRAPSVNEPIAQDEQEENRPLYLDG